MCPLNRCGYSLTWLDESLRSLITLNGWLVPTKVGYFLINTFCDSFMLQRRTGTNMIDGGSVVWWGCVFVNRVCFLHACAGFRFFLPRGNEVALAEVRGQSALIPLPVSVYLLAAYCWWLPRVSALDECPLDGKVIARKKNRSQRDCGMTSPKPPSPYRPPLWNNLTCPLWNIVSNSRSWRRVKWFLCRSELKHWKSAAEGFVAVQ